MSKSQPQPWTIGKEPTSANGHSVHKSKPPRQSKNGRWSALTRWLHLYLSMVSFAVVLFFAVTGLTLNHADWFDDAAVTNEFKGQLNAAWVNSDDTAKVAKLAVVEFLRNTHAILGPVSDFRIDQRECSVSFRGPGFSADAFIDRETGEYQLTETRLGLVAVMNDLHKGRDTGRSWSWVIDASAIFMTLVSVTGLVLLLFLKKRRLNGLLWAAAGLAVCVLVYYFS